MQTRSCIRSVSDVASVPVVPGHQGTEACIGLVKTDRVTLQASQGHSSNQIAAALALCESKGAPGTGALMPPSEIGAAATGLFLSRHATARRLQEGSQG